MKHDFLRIKNWQKYQHYTKRRPPWIKLHFSILSSKDWVCSTDASRLLAVVCMLLASQSEHKDGRFEADPEYFQRLARLETPPIFKPLIDMGFLEYASECVQVLANATPEAETEAETKTEKPRAQTRSARNRFDEMMEQKRKIEAQAKRLLQEQAVAVELNVGGGPR
jgi:hypothetical protein